uniref:Serpentine receptor class gamma n=1 Tax=Steinernema glaseri TaxID=37863 RepID=A0A1I8A409_9BILA
MVGAVIYKARYEPICLFVICSITVVSSVLSLLLYVSRPRKSHPLGMLFVFLATNIVYGLLNISVSVIQFLVKKRLVRGIFYLIMWNITSPQLSEQVASLGGTFLALDRVLIMSLTLRYTRWRIGVRLAIICSLINTVLVVTMIASVRLVEAIEFCFQIVLFFNPKVKYYAFPGTLLVQGIFDTIFCVQFWKHSKKHRSSSSKQANHIALFQVVSHTFLCSIPQLLLMVRVLFPVGDTKWLFYAVPYYELLFSISVLLTSLFTLYKLRPKKVTLKICFYTSIVWKYKKKPY